MANATPWMDAAVPGRTEPRWRVCWEQALFQDDRRLLDLARGARQRLRRLSASVQGESVRMLFQDPSQGKVEVSLRLSRFSAEAWWTGLRQLGARLPAWASGVPPYPETRVLAELDGLELPLLPRDWSEVEVVAWPASGQRPCPFVLSALVELGGMLELNPRLLFAMRGLNVPVQDLAPDQPAGHGDDSAAETPRDADPTPARVERLRERFWGNARTIRNFAFRYDPEQVLHMPVRTLGPPPVEDEAVRRALGQLMEALYREGGADSV